MKSKSYQASSRAILADVGGKENIARFTHCFTRLRFEVKDAGLIDDESIKAVEGVAGTAWLGNQYQVIIGTDVQKYYSLICSEADLEAEAAIDENLDELPRKGFKLSPSEVGNAVLAYLSPTMLNLLPTLITACLLKTVAYILGPDVAGLIGADSGVYVTLNFMYQAFFYYIPLFLGYSACKALNLNPVYGIYLGAIILAPDYMALIGSQASIDIFGIPCPVSDYSNSFLPIILGVWICSFVYKGLDRVIPSLLKSLLVPLLTMVIMAPVMFGICAPIGNYAGTAIAQFFVFLSEGSFIVRVIGFVVLAAALPYMVITGMHGAIMTFGIMIIAQNGFETMIVPLLNSYNWAVFGVAVGAVIKMRVQRNAYVTEALEYTMTCIVGGVTEPILYGILIKYKRTLLALLVASLVSGAYCGIFMPQSFMLTTASVFGAWSEYAGGTTLNLLSGVISLALPFVAGVVSAYFIDYSEN